MTGEYGECSSVVSLFFVEKSFTKTHRCAEAMPWRINQLLVLHFTGLFLLTASPKTTKDIRVHFFIYIFKIFTFLYLHFYNFPHAAIPWNYACVFRQIFVATTCLCYKFVWYDMIYLLTAVGLSPGGSSTVHIYTQTVHRTTQNKQYIEQNNNLGECGPCPVLASYTLAFALHLRKKHGKPSVRVAASKNT